jgi:hypothetical protein
LSFDLNALGATLIGAGKNSCAPNGDLALLGGPFAALTGGEKNHEAITHQDCAVRSRDGGPVRADYAYGQRSSIRDVPPGW